MATPGKPVSGSVLALLNAHGIDPYAGQAEDNEDGEQAGSEEGPSGS